MEGRSPSFIVALPVKAMSKPKQMQIGGFTIFLLQVNRNRGVNGMSDINVQKLDRYMVCMQENFEYLRMIRKSN